MSLFHVAITRRLFAVGAVAAALSLRATAARPASAPSELASPTSGPRHIRTLDRQRLRGGLGLHEVVLAMVPPGTVVTVLSAPRFIDGHTWYEVSSPHCRGWMAVDVVESACDTKIE